MTLPALCNRQTAENCQYLRFCFIAPGLFYYQEMIAHTPNRPQSPKYLWKSPWNDRIRRFSLACVCALTLALPHSAISDEMASKASNTSG
ncbi:MAG: hypothetical protein OEY84_02310, partial [Rhodospirillaceae bacterium]|nr:hypothetical protein [Rhodospirillaceae bacterium]